MAGGSAGGVGYVIGGGNSPWNNTGAAAPISQTVPQYQQGPSSTPSYSTFMQSGANYPNFDAFYAAGVSSGVFDPNSPVGRAAAQKAYNSSGGGAQQAASGGNTNPFSVAPSAPMASSSPTYNANPGSFGANLPPYQVGGQIAADMSVQNAMQKMGQTNSYQQGAQVAANYAGTQASGQGAANIGQAGAMRTGANQVMNTAMDPQGALYNRTAQQLQDQIRVGEAARGITMSPYGAGIENQGMSNFNIDWQNAQLGRQTQGLTAAGTANTQASNLGQVGVGQYQAAGAIPAETFNTGQQYGQQSIQDWLAYLGQGTTASNASSASPQLVPPPSTITFGGNMANGGMIY